MDNSTKQIVEQIRRGEIDINNQSLFFKSLIRGLLLKLKEDIAIRNIPVPHYILHTGDDIMYLENKGQDASIEPTEISNEEYIYSQIPRCIVEPGSIDVVPDQLTNPYSRGYLTYESEDSIYSLSAEFRRMPVKLSCELKYYVDSFTDLMELVQQIISKLCFIRTYNITYMGQTIGCSYKIPESFDGEHMTELDGTTTDNKARTMTLSIEVESNFPVYSPRTAVSATSIINMYPSNSDLTRGSETKVGDIHISGDHIPPADYEEYVKTGEFPQNPDPVDYTDIMIKSKVHVNESI